MRGFQVTLMLGCCWLASCSPPEPPEPGVRVGTSLLTREPFATIGKAWVARIQVAQLDSEPGPEVAVFGNGLHIVDPMTGELKTKVETAIGYDHSVVKVGDAGDFLIMAGGGGYAAVGLMAADGSLLWSYEGGSRVRVNCMAAGDLDGDGSPEFYVGTNRGLHRLDEKGKKVWGRAADTIVWEVTVLDPTDSSRPLVVARTHDKHLQFWDSEGNLVRTVPQVQGLDLQACQWPAPGHLVLIYPHAVCILDDSGNTVFKYALEEQTPDKTIFSVRAVPVRLSARQEPYLAILVKFQARFRRAMLCVFSPERILVYSEVVGPTTGLCAMPGRSGSSDVEVLLVGDGPDVYRYRLSQQPQR